MAKNRLDPIQQRLLVAGLLLLLLDVVFSAKVRNAEPTTSSANKQALPFEVVCEVPTVEHGSVEKFTANGVRGTLTERRVLPRTEIAVTCQSGYGIENAPSRVICLHDGTWSGRIGECKLLAQGRVACVVPEVENGSIRVLSPRRRLGRKLNKMERVPIGSRVHLRCDRDFFLSDGPYETGCRSDGNWAVHLGKCLPIATEENDCGVEPNLAHAKVGPRTADTRTIECDEGYQLIGSGIIRCEKDGQWSYLDNACQRICQELPKVPNGFLSDGSNFAGNERSISCSNGYEIRGSKRITCNATNGQWSAPGSCEQSCSMAPTIVNGSIEDGTSWVGSERKIRCNEGFAVAGLETVRCGADARWIVGGICRKACGVEPTIINGAVKKGEFAVGSERVVTCDVGFVLKGPSSIRCDENAEWSETGFCKKESIHHAAELGDIDAVRHLIGRQPELLEVKNAYGDSPLWRAAHNGQVEVVKLLLTEGANVDSRGLYGRTPLHEASALGHIEVVRLLLKNGANVHATSNEHDSRDMPIHLAAFEGHLEVVRALIEASPDLADKKDMHGRTPLDLAKISNHGRASDVVRFFRSRSCDSEPVISHGRLGNGSSSIAGERSIICDEGYALKGANKIRCKTGGQWSEPGVCIAKEKECGPLPTLANGRVNDGASLIGSERSVSCSYGFELSGTNKVRCDRNGQWTTPGTCQPSESIFWAASMGHEEVVKALSASNPELLSDRDRANSSVLAIAAAGGHLAIVDFLLSKPGVNIETRDKDGRTALALAAAKGHLRVVKLLVKKGANVHSRSGDEDFEDQPIHLAAVGGHTETVDFLVTEDRGLLLARNRDGDFALHRAVVGNHLETAKALLDLGANVEARNNDGWTPLCHAAAEGNLDIVELLVDRGANIFTRTNVDDDEDMPIHLASYFGHLNVVTYLIDKHPELMAVRNREGESPINRAAVGGHTAIVELLLSKGVDIETKGFRGRTPLHEAASKGHLKLVKMLIRSNANLTARSDRDTDRGSLPIHLASYFGQIDVVRFLLETKPELIHAKNSRGQTPLEHAIAGGSVHNAQEVVRYLSEKTGDHGQGSLLPR